MLFFLAFSFAYIFSSLFSQLLPAMSRKSKPGMSRDELEIQAVLSPTGSQSTVSTPAPGQQPRDVAPSEQPPQVASLSKECMMDFATVVAHSVAMAIQGSGLGPDDSPPHEEFDSSSDEEDGDEVGVTTSCLLARLSWHNMETHYLFSGLALMRIFPYRATTMWQKLWL